MNIKEKEYFEELSIDRAESADLLEKPSMRGIKRSVVEKYSDQAHFIYELLQNADDAKATYARFKLCKDSLIFAHNRSRHFSISDPKSEEQDSYNGILGDINAITSIANSNKTKSSIGKFGVGFKAVFQYTSTPKIYDPNISFQIDRFIVPTVIDEDFPNRYPEETLFIFPFDHPERDPIESYKDISQKLKNLSFPLLFLTTLRNIELEFEDVLDLYGKNFQKTYKFNDVIAESICLSQNNGEDSYDYNLWLFSKKDEKNNLYSVGYFIDDQGSLCPVKETVFCFFLLKR